MLYRFNLNFLYEVKSSELLFVFVVVVVFCSCTTYIIYEITEETDKLKLKQFQLSKYHNNEGIILKCEKVGTLGRESFYNSRLSMIVRVNVVLNRTVLVFSD